MVRMKALNDKLEYNKDDYTNYSVNQISKPKYQNQVNI